MRASVRLCGGGASFSRKKTESKIKTPSVSLRRWLEAHPPIYGSPHQHAAELCERLRRCALGVPESDTITCTSPPDASPNTQGVINALSELDWACRTHSEAAWTAPIHLLYPLCRALVDSAGKLDPRLQRAIARMIRKLVHVHCACAEATEEESGGLRDLLDEVASVLPQADETVFATAVRLEIECARVAMDASLFASSQKQLVQVARWLSTDGPRVGPGFDSKAVQRELEEVWAMVRERQGDTWYEEVLQVELLSSLVLSATVEGEAAEALTFLQERAGEHNFDWRGRTIIVQNLLKIIYLTEFKSVALQAWSGLHEMTHPGLEQLLRMQRGIDSWRTRVCAVEACVMLSSKNSIKLNVGAGVQAITIGTPIVEIREAAAAAMEQRETREENPRVRAALASPHDFLAECALDWWVDWQRIRRSDDVPAYLQPHSKKHSGVKSIAGSMSSAGMHVHAMSDMDGVADSAEKTPPHVDSDGGMMV